MRPVRPTLFLLAAIGLGACGESAAPRDPLHGSSLSVVAVRGSKDSTSDAVDSVDIVVRRGDGSVAGHGAAFFPAGVDTVPVVVTLIVTNDVETLTLTMELLANGTVVYTTTNTITVRRGESNSAPSVVPAVWSKLTPTIGPAPRVGPATAFDASRGVLVMFGGLVLGQPQTDTWEWDRAAGWRVIATTGNPPGRAAHTMVYDPIRHVVVAFGGASGDGVIGDTWTYDGATATWTKINSATSPKARVGASAAFDQGRQAVILFGGSDSSGVMNDTWKFDGTSWSVVATDSSPSGRVFSGMAYDAAAGRARVELVGGYDTHDVLGDRWVLGLGAPGWRHEVAAGSPGPRAGHVLAYDASLNRLVLYGGTDSDTLRFDTWVFDGTWHQLATTAHPPSSVGIGAGFFPSVAPGVNRLVIFGGYDGTVATNQTWSLDTDWLREADASLPTTREQATFALLPGVGGVMFGGSGGASDTWVFANGGWIPLRSAGGPGQRQGSAMAFDGTRMVLFGGRPNTLAPAGDTWLFDGRRWTASAATGPTARSNQAMVYDPVRHKTLMFGGQAASGPLGDTWLWDGSLWTQLSTTGAIPSRRDHAAGFDTDRGRMVVVGGQGEGTSAPLLGDMWELVGTSWSLVPLGAGASRPDARTGAVMVFRGAGLGSLYFGGRSTAGPLNDIWSVR